MNEEENRGEWDEAGMKFYGSFRSALFEDNPGESDADKWYKANTLARAQMAMRQVGTAEEDKGLSDTQKLAKAMTIASSLIGDGVRDDVFLSGFNGGTGFKDGQSALDKMRLVVKGLEDGPEKDLDDFRKLPYEQGLKIALDDKGVVDGLVHSAGNAGSSVGDWWSRGGGALPLDEGEIKEADPEMVAASDILRENAEYESAMKDYLTAGRHGRKVEAPERKHDEAKVKEATDRVRAWREDRYNRGVYDAYVAKLAKKARNACLSSIITNPVFGSVPNARKVLNDLLNSTDNAVPVEDEDMFAALPGHVRSLIITARSVMRPDVESGFWNTLGDFAISMANTGLNVATSPYRQGTKIGNMLANEKFDAGIDVNEINRRKQDLYAATGRFFAGGDAESGTLPMMQFEQLCDNHGMLADAVIGTASILGYGAAVGTGPWGVAAMTLEAMQQMDDHVAAEGGDITNGAYNLSNLAFGLAYGYTEHLKWGGFLKSWSEVKIRKAFFEGYLKFLKDHPVDALRRYFTLGGTEAAEEGLQKLTTNVNEALFLGKDVGRAAAEGFVGDMIETLPSMMIVGPAGDLVGHAKRSGFRFGEEGQANRTADMTALAELMVNQDNLVALGRDEARKGAEKYAAMYAGIYDEYKRQGIDAIGRAFKLTETQKADLEEFYKAIEAEIDKSGAGVADAFGQVVGKGYANLFSFKAFSDIASNLLEDFKKEYAKGAPGREGRVENWMSDEFWQKYRAAWAKGNMLVSVETKDGLKIKTDLGAQELEKLGLGKKAAEKLSAFFRFERNHIFSRQATEAIRDLYDRQTRLQLTTPQVIERMFKGRVVHRDGKMFVRYEAEQGPSETAGSGMREVEVRDENLEELEPNFDTPVLSQAQSIDDATHGEVSAEKWMNGMTPDERREAWKRMRWSGVGVQGGFSVIDTRSGNAVTSRQLWEMMKAGEKPELQGVITVDPYAPNRATPFHELAHGYVVFAISSGLLTEADINALAADPAVGPATGRNELFNEENFSNAFRDYLVRRRAGSAIADTAANRAMGKLWNFGKRVSQEGEKRSEDAKVAQTRMQAIFDQIALGVYAKVAKTSPAAKPENKGENGGGGRVSETEAKTSPLEFVSEGVSLDDANAALSKLKGKDYTNKATGITARLSSDGAGKLVSNAAVAKSQKNGFTKEQHNSLAANIDHLFENAFLYEERPDRNGDVNIKSIKRFVCPVRFGENEAAAYITVKESVEHGHRIYSVEGMKIAELSPMVRRVLSGRNSADNSATADSIAKSAAEVKPASKSDEWEAAVPKSPYRVKGHYLVLKLGDIVSSDDPAYAVHKDWQNRIGENKLAEASLQQIKDSFYWKAYGDSAFTDTGAPIVLIAEDAEGKLRPFVVSGNGRIMVLKSLLKDHMYDRYRGGLKEMAAAMGLEVPEDGEEHVLVRVIDDLGGISIDEFVTKSNGDNKRKVGDAARAKQDAATIVANGLAPLYKANADGTPDMTPGVNDEFFRLFSQRATDGDAIYDENFNVVEEWRNRVMRALLYVSCGQGDRGPETVDKVIQMTDTLGIRRQRNAMECCAAAVAALEANPDYAIGPDVSRAMADYMEFVEKKRAGKVGTFAEYLGEQDMFDPRSEIADGVLRLLEGSKNAREIADTVRRYCDIATKSDRDGGLQGAEAARTREDVWREAVKSGGERYSFGAAVGALSEIVNGKDFGVVQNAKYGEVRYPLGKSGKGGFGLLHIIDRRMQKDGMSLDEAIDTAIRVGVSAQIGIETASPYNTHHLDYNGTRAIIAEMKDHSKVITGYEIDANETAAANRRARAVTPQPHVSSEEVIRAADRSGITSRAKPDLPHLPTPRSEDVIAALKNRIAQIRGNGNRLADAVKELGGNIGSERMKRLEARYSFAAANPVTLTSKDVALAISKWGTTDDINKGIYCLPDGTMLQGKGQAYVIGGRRIEAFGHDGWIDLILKNAPKVDTSTLEGVAEAGGQIEAAQRGIAALGAIRIVGDKNGFTVSKEPTAAQYDALYDMAEKAYQVMESNGDDEMLIDVTDENLETLFALRYARGTSPRRIIDDLRGWYERGEKPGEREQSLVAMFHGEAERWSIAPKGAQKGAAVEYPDAGAELRAMDDAEPKERALEVRDIDGTHKVKRLSDSIHGMSLAEVRKFLTENKESYVRLYHGTGAESVAHEGIRRTNAKNRRTTASSKGFVYLSVHPHTARMFGEFGYGNATVWAVDVKVKDLHPDKDSLFLARRDGGAQIEKDGLAESIYYTGNARVRRDILPYEMSATRWSVAASPTLREDVEAALNTDRTKGEIVKGEKRVVFCRTPEVLKFVGLKDADVYSKAHVLRKVEREHGVTADQIVGMPELINDPVAIFDDYGKGYVVLTTAQTPDEDGVLAPLAIIIRPDEEGNYIASAYSRKEASEAKYVGFVRDGKVLYLDKNKVTDLTLRGEAQSSLSTFSIGDNVATPERITAEIIAKSAADGNGMRWSIGARRRAEFRELMGRKRPDIAAEDIEAYLDEIAGYDNAKKQKLAVHWIITGAIELPEDAYKLDKAIATAERAKVDPFQYRNPEDIFAAFPQHLPKEKPIDPDTVPELTAKEDRGHGITVYTVSEKIVKGKRRAGQVAMRKVINTHWGKDASPWCLLQGDGNGELTEESRGYWEHYSALPKKVAFLNGRLLAFMATDERKYNPEAFAEDFSQPFSEEYPELVSEYEGWLEEQGDDGDWATLHEWLEINHPKELEEYESSVSEQWWDRKDASHAGIPIEGKIEGDPLGRSGLQELKDGKLELVGRTWKGDRKNGKYEEWEGEQKKLDAEFKDGRPVGWRRTYRNGELSTVEHYNAKSEHDRPQLEFYPDLRLASVIVYGEGDMPLRSMQFETDGKLSKYQETGGPIGLAKRSISRGLFSHHIAWTDDSGKYFSVYKRNDGELLDVKTNGEYGVEWLAETDDEYAALPSELRAKLEGESAAVLEAVKAEAAAIYREYSANDGAAQDGVSQDGVRWSIAGEEGAWRLGVRNQEDAIRMEGEGASAIDVWKTTGWFRGKDGKWRYEIKPITSLRASGVKRIRNGETVSLRSVVYANELFRAYPDLADIKLEAGEQKGYFTAAGNKITYPQEVDKADTRSIIRLINHEIQHLIQNRERMSKGTGFGKLNNWSNASMVAQREVAKKHGVPESFLGIFGPYLSEVIEIANDAGINEHPIFNRIRKPDEFYDWGWERQDAWEADHDKLRTEAIKEDADFKDLLSKLPVESRAKIKKAVGDVIRQGKLLKEAAELAESKLYRERDWYNDAAGEVEARASGERALMSAKDRLATPPWESEDTPRGQQYIDFVRPDKSERMLYGGQQRWSMAKAEAEKNVDEMLSKFDEARGKSKEEIFKQYDNEQKIIGALPEDINLPEALRVAEPVVKAAQAYMLDHLLNQPGHEFSYDADDAKRVIGLIDPRNEMRVVQQRNSSSLAFIGNNPKGGWDCIVIAPRRGEFYVFKTMFGQTKKPYQDKVQVRYSFGSSVRNSAVDSLLRGPLASIRDVDQTPRSISNPAAADNPLAAIANARTSREVEEAARLSFSARLADGDEGAAERALVNYVAYHKLTGGAIPRAATLAKLGLTLGMKSVQAKRIIEDAQRVADRAAGTVIEKAARNGDVGTAFSLMEREKEREEELRKIISGGAKAGGDLVLGGVVAQGTLLGKRIEQTMRTMTAADLADMEGDTGIDLAAEILENDPKAFDEELKAVKPKRGEEAEGEGEGEDEGEDEGGAVGDDGLTDREKWKRSEAKKEAAKRVQEFIERAKQKAEENKQKAAQRREENRQRVIAGETPVEPGMGDTVDGEKFGAPEKSVAGFRNKWEFAAFVREWAWDKYQKTHGTTSLGKSEENRLFAEFYRKCAAKMLQDLADKLLDPKGARAWANRRIGELEKGLRPDTIERASADIFAFINRNAIREERGKLIEKFRKEIREFITGKEFEELKADSTRRLTGWVEEAARYMMKVCQLSAWATNGHASAFEKERNELLSKIEERREVYDGSGRDEAYMEANDAEIVRARWKLALLEQYGGMAQMMPGEIESLREDAIRYLTEEAVALEERWKDTKEKQDRLRRAIAGGIVGPNGQRYESKAGWFGHLFDDLNGLLRLRLKHLMRFAGKKERAEGEAAINEIVNMLGRGEVTYARAVQRDRRELFAALGRIFQNKDGRPNRRAIREYLKRMEEDIPAELSRQLSNQGFAEHMTYGQMLQLLVSLEQKSYAENVRVCGRGGQAELIRNSAAFTQADALFIDWLRAFYEAKRGEISEVTMRMVGNRVDSPDPLYCPVKIYRGELAKDLHIDAGRWNAIDDVLSRRVMHLRDFDESASILGQFYDRSNRMAGLIAWAESGTVIQNVICSGAVQQQINLAFGSGESAKIRRQLEDTFNGGTSRSKTPGEIVFMDKAMNFITFGYLGFNPLSAAKQTTSFTVWANVLPGGFRELWHHMTHIDREAVRHIMESDEYKVRYGDDTGSGQDFATKALNENAGQNPFMQLMTGPGMWLLKKGDFLPGIWIMQGVYKSLLNKHLNEGMDEAAADRQAITEAFNLLEETQQSGRTYNTSALAREHGRLGSALVQFATSPLQQLQYETQAFREWRDLKRYGADPERIAEARAKLVRAAFINHVLLPAAMELVITVFRAIMGDEPKWEKDGYAWDLLRDILLGQASRIFYVGVLASSMIDALFKRQMPRGSQLIPSEGAITVLANVAITAHDVVTLDGDKVQKDLERMAKSLAPTRIPYNLYRRVTGDSDVDRKKAKAK